MADEEHLAILRQGVDAWNEWRKANTDVMPDLKGAHLRRADLIGANLCYVDFTDAYLRDSYLRDADVGLADLRCADLGGADLGGARLTNTDLRDANLRRADLSGANLYYADLSGANLRDADLSTVQALGTNFVGATLTGACIADWNINADTNLNNVDCNYVYLKYNKKTREYRSERRPSDPAKSFAPGEFTALFQKALETVDLIFADGIDWRAFFQSFQELQSQYADQELSIQAIEKKAGGAFIIRLETPAVDVDKAAIESAAMEKYQAQLQLVEAQYRNQLQGIQVEHQNEIITLQRQHSSELIEVVRSMASKPVIITNTNSNTVEANAVSNSQSSGDTYNGIIKATNFAPHGTAIGGTFNDYSQTITNNLDEIQQLITTLRSQAEQFPQDARDDADVHLGDLEDDLKHPDKQDPKRIKAKLMALLAIAVGLGGAIATATDFSNNVLELGKKFGVELQTQNPQSCQYPRSQGTPTVDVKRLEGGH